MRALLILALLAGCGGGGGSETDTEEVACPDDPDALCTSICTTHSDQVGCDACGCLAACVANPASFAMCASGTCDPLAAEGDFDGFCACQEEC